MERRSARPSREQLYEEHVSFVFWVVARLGIGPADREDAVHEVFIAAFKSLDTFDPSRPVRPWLHGIAFHVCDHLHRQKRETPAEDAGEGAEMSAGPEGRLAAKEELCALLAAVPLVRRVVLLMHDGDGFAMADIANALGITPNTGYKRLEKAREELAAAVARQRARDRQALGGIAIPFDVATFLAEHRDAPEAPASARGRVWSSLSRSLAGAGPSPGVHAARRLARPAARYLASQLPGAIVGAIGGGAVVYALLREPPVPPSVRPAPELVALDRRGVSPPSSASAVEPTAEQAPAASSAVPPLAAPAMMPSSSASPPSSAAAGLDGEALLLQRARWYYAQHDLKAAREALDLHAATYPHGRLAHAREALRAAIAAPAPTTRQRFGVDEQ